MKGFVATTCLTFVAFCATAVGESALPGPDGMPCPSFIAPDAGECFFLGGKGNGTSEGGGWDPLVALGISHSPALPAMAAGSATQGSAAIATGMANVPKVSMPYFAEMNIFTGYPVLHRIDCDHSSNGPFGLTLERNFIGRPLHYSRNTDGRTMFGPEWTCNFDVKLERSGDWMYLRLDTGGYLTFQPMGNNVYRANPDVIAATMTGPLTNPPSYDWNSETWRMQVAGGDAT